MISVHPIRMLLTIYREDSALLESLRIRFTF
jgi:hypothetical protein